MTRREPEPKPTVSARQPLGVPRRLTPTPEAA